MKAVRMNVSGRVQGVGFRYTTKLLADRLKVVGWVKNNIDGTVDIEAQAEDSVLNQFIDGVKASPSPSGRVNKLTIKSIPIFNTQHFIVKY